MANIPDAPEKLKSHETDFGSSIAEALWVKAAQLTNYLDKSYPIGMILFFHETQELLPAPPNTDYWQELDGSEVMNTASPLLGQTLPDLRNKFFRHPKTGEITLSSGGQATVNLSHNHGGTTGLTDDRAGFNTDGGGEHPQAGPHTHSIASSLSSTTSTTPRYIALKLYVRIA